MVDSHTPERPSADLPLGPTDSQTPIVSEPTETGDGQGPLQSSATDEAAKVVNDVLHSDIGVNLLLNRLKQSITSARDFASYLKKRSALEEEHAQGLKKLCRVTHESIRRPEHRQGSFAQQYDEITRFQERMADNGINFGLELHRMHEELHDLTNNLERGRKHWKQTGLNAEKKVQDAESAMDKAKGKYDSLAEDYNRARTGDKQSGKIFGLKGPKSAVQLEEDLHRKVQAADADYGSKVHTARTQRQELLSNLRPQAVKALQELISECDSALTLQLQRFASSNEKLLLNNGTSISPLRSDLNGHGPEPHSLRDAIWRIDNEKDIREYILSFSSKVPPKHAEIKFERHPTLAPSQQALPQSNRQSQPYLSQQPPSAFASHVPPPGPPGSDTQGLNQPNIPDSQPVPEKDHSGPPQQHHYPPPAFGESPQSAGPPFAPAPYSQPQPHIQPQATTPGNSTGTYPADLPPLKPVFGVALEDLFLRDGSAVPMVVYQCLQAVDLFGLEVEGIYRLSGTASHVSKIKAMFDNDSSQVDFRNPENFFHDVNSVAGLLKQFFRDLPDPLLTSEHYAELINASRIDDDIIRRDSLHAVINSLPDPNYATLRALTL
ncbi:MAG: hypothetical protein M1835_002336, partial [Candelina submexicana]